MSIIDILEVVSESELHPQSNFFVGCRIDNPASASQFDMYSFMIDGWVLGKPSPGDYTELISEGELLTRMPLNVRRQDIPKAYPGVPGSDSAGFRTIISALRLPNQFNLTVVAVLKDGTRFRIGRISGRRQSLTLKTDPRINPLLLATIGRSGSTWLTFLLAHNPQIVVYEPFSYEPRILSYWLDILKTLSQPQSFRLALQGDLTGEYWWTGERAQIPYTRLVESSGVQRWLAKDHVEDLIDFCRNRIETTYREIAKSYEHKDPLYFAEKIGLRQTTNPLIYELYPQTRDVYLVRDFRDVFCSILAYNKKRGFNSFGRELVDSDLQFVHHLGQFASSLLHSWKHRNGQGYLLRYEDLIQDPESSLVSLMEYLNLDSSATTIQRMLRQARAGKPGMQKGHQTSSGPEASIGRWRQDLSPELQAECQKVFDSLLPEFGYSSD